VTLRHSAPLTATQWCEASCGLSPGPCLRVSYLTKAGRAPRWETARWPVLRAGQGGTGPLLTNKANILFTGGRDPARDVVAAARPNSIAEPRPGLGQCGPLSVWVSVLVSVDPVPVVPTTLVQASVNGILPWYSLRNIHCQ
jgi:hypothetical protein